MKYISTDNIVFYLFFITISSPEEKRARCRQLRFDKNVITILLVLNWIYPRRAYWKLLIGMIKETTHAYSINN